MTLFILLPMDYAMSLLEIIQSFDRGHGHLATDGFWNGLFKLLEQLVEASGHQLHTNPHIRLGNETA